MTKANLGIAIIARNAEKTIGDCLDSIVPFIQQTVVCVDRTNTDATAQVARDHGAEVHEGHKVSDYHECGYHGKVLVQHFANARQTSFSYLNPALAFHGWIDADDVVEGGEKIEKLLSELPQEVAGVWLPYHYAKAGDHGPTSTLFDRERFVRTSIQWAWKHRVHEVLTPVGITTEELQWTRTDDIRIVHQHIGHDTSGSAKRNITLLELDLEEDENDMRAWFYLGNQYFALSDWGKAAECYERACASDNPYQLWQTLLYLSMSYEKIGDLQSSRLAAFRALEVQPNHPDPYYRLASTYMLQGDLERTEFWTRFGDTLPDPPFFVFRNPLDKPYNARLTLATAYANAGHTSKAKRELEQAARVIPSKEILDGIAYHKKIEQDALLADAWVKVLTSQDHLPEKRNGINDDVWKFGRVRDIIVPNLISNRGCSKPRIIFFCGKSAEPWAPVSLNTTGIGGSETAVVQIAKRFSQSGWWVDVYNDCDHLEGEYDGVGYWDTNRLEAGEHTDIFVSWRNPRAYELPIQRGMSLLWCHDLHSGVGVRSYMAQWDKVLGVSGWHRDYLSKVYGISNTDYVPNGIELERFSSSVSKVPFRCVYASSPDRGLETLLNIWPSIVEQEPKAELHIAYGWDTMDKYIAIGHQQLAVFKQHVEAVIARTPNVVWTGRLAQDKLAELYSSAYALLYPSTFLEVSCIVVMEAMAAGCPVVTSGVGALPETIGSGGLVVPGNVYTDAWREFYTHVTRGMIATPQLRKQYEDAGRERAKELTWDKAFDRWEEITLPVIERGLVAACAVKT